MDHLKFKFVNKAFSTAEKDLLRPKRQSETASGFDLVAAHDAEILAGKRALIATGVSIELSRGFEGQVRSRSGLAIKNGIIVLNAPGTIDADYRGEIKVILANTGSEPFQISMGMRVAQLVIASVSLPELIECDDLQETLRGELGFGSTGLGHRA
jgi:dUTP pyrophosphatase